MELRDPFKRRTNKKKAANSNKGQLTGVYNNQNNNSIENKPIESIRIIGIVLGSERRAMAKVIGEDKDSEGGSNIYYIKERRIIIPFYII